MKFKFNAGAELDLITRDEVREVLDHFRTNWISELQRGDRYRDFRSAGTISGGAVSIGGDTDQIDMGPAAGFMWIVKRLAVVNLTAGDKLTLFKNDNNPSTTVKPVLADYNAFGSNELVLYPGDKLLVQNNGALSGTGIITITGSARELPIAMAWRAGQ